MYLNWLKHETLHLIVMALACVFQGAALKYSAAAIRGLAGSHQGANSEHVLIYVPTNVMRCNSSVDFAKVSLKVLSHLCCAESPTNRAVDEKGSSFLSAASTADILSLHPVAFQGYQLQAAGNAPLILHLRRCNITPALRIR